MKRYTFYPVVAILALFLLIFACSKEDASATKPAVSVSQDAPAVAQSSTKTQVDEKGFRTVIAKVAKDNIPAVVHIEVTQSQVVENPFFPFENDPFFKHFFNTPQAPRKFKRELRGIGTGMIINENGYILTNYHVVAGATQIQVSLSNTNQYQAKVIGTDPKTDLAIIKVNAKEKLPFVTFGDSDKVEVGEWVIAIGQPRGLLESVTQGIISAKHRQGITDPSTYQDFLQTDAAINPGNSGGPLINLDGLVIGVNSIIASQSGGFEGIGFAIPSNIAIHVSKALMETGKVLRGWLGITLQDITFEKMKALKLSSNKGALVMEVVKGGPADKAGFKAGDVIVSFEGKDISDSGELRNLVANTPIGKEVKIGILREGKKLSVPVKIGNLEDAAKMMASSVRDKLGVEVRPVNDAERSKYGLDENQGVVVSKLDPKGPLTNAGFEVNDVMLMVNNQPIEGVEQFAALVASLKAHQTITILVVDHRSGQTGYVQVEVR
jgi:serine protease Do